MAITVDQIYSQIEATLSALEKMPARERQEYPSRDFGENYNNLLALAKEAMPAIDNRRWPPTARIHNPSMGLPTSEARYVEIHSYLKQIQSILEDGREPVSPISFI